MGLWDLAGNETAQQLLTVAVIGSWGVILFLYRELSHWRKKWADDTELWRRKWAEEVKERSRDAELFLKALAKKRSGSSEPPTSTTPTENPQAFTRSGH